MLATDPLAPVAPRLVLGSPTWAAGRLGSATSM
jgi:hypothetical protein